ncbi:MerR family regulatory protein [Streptococcus porcinus]|uniref:stress response transcriptional regulator NmlR n=1 Tax=Streptococcus porcinus TaxID=1340 RepID=UPI0010CACE19|nr:stress response transcriptional regulator NmlR [Streptococcus porcinus]VTS23717.1 MerR family regulatory protein [Streptococcus porcinus]
MHIKKVSELTGVSADTIRYYERIGLIPIIRRSESGIRNFSEHDVNVLEFVRFFRGAGVSVECLIDYISLVEQGDATIKARLSILQEEKEGLEGRIDTLQKALKRLNHKIENYHNKVVPREHELFDKDESEE